VPPNLGILSLEALPQNGDSDRHQKGTAPSSWARGGWLAPGGEAVLSDGLRQHRALHEARELMKASGRFGFLLLLELSTKC